MIVSDNFKKEQALNTFLFLQPKKQSMYSIKKEESN